MKYKTSLIALLLSSGSVMAADDSLNNEQHFYIGASAGYSAINTPSGDAFNTGTTTTETLITQTSSSSDIGGFGGSLFAGYNMNKHFAVELDYTSYAKSKYSSTQSQYTNIGGDPTNWAYNGSNTASIDYTTYSIDLFLKASMPIIAKVSAFAKIGASYVNQSVDYTNSGDIPSISVNNSELATPESGNNTYTAIRPSGALGLSMELSEHFTGSVFAQGFLGSGDISTDSSAIASAYLLGASLAYTF